MSTFVLMYMCTYVYIYIYIYVYIERERETGRERERQRYTFTYIDICIVSVAQNAGRCDFIENRDVKILKKNPVGFVLNPKSLQVFSRVFPQ